MSPDEQLFDAAEKGDVAVLAGLLDERPEKLSVRDKPYEHTLLHVAARNGHLPVVDLLLKRGLDVNVRERGDNTYPMHWAAAAGNLEVVRRLADAGGDVVGHGDDHELEVIGWATCWDGGDDASHRAVADFLVSRGARHHMYSAISLNLADEVRRIVASDPATLNSRLSRNENHQTPLHCAVMKNRPEMVALLIDLGADPLAVDGSGLTAAVCASRPDTDRKAMEKIRAMTSAELQSAERGSRPARIGLLDLVALLSLGDWETAERLLRGDPERVASKGPAHGVLHVMAKRNDPAAVQWLLEHGLDPNSGWTHYDTDGVTPLHLAAGGGHAEVVRILLKAGADPLRRDTKHDADALGWAEFFKQPEIAEILKDAEPGA